MKNTKTLIRNLVTATIVSGLAMYAHAQYLNGTLDSAFYGSPLAIQTINTGYGNSTVGDGTSAGGSELDAAYGAISGGNLYLFLAGNLEDNGNHLDLFIAGGAPGQNTLNVPNTASMVNMNGSVFSPGFQATFALNVNDSSGVNYVEEYSLTGTPSGGYVGSIPLSGGIGTGTPGISTIALNNTHISTMGAMGAAANTAAMLSTTTGFEFAIPLSAIGWTGGSVMVLTDINGTSDNYLSNQFLPGLPVGTQDLGGTYGPTSGQFNFSNTPGEYFTVSVPEPSTLAICGLSGLAALLAVRKRK